MSEPAVVLDRVVKRVGGVPALDGISATLETGELVALAGPSGAGKTTLMRLIAGLLRPDAGRIAVCGHDMIHAASLAQAAIGFVPQHSGVYDRLTIRENLELHAGLRNLSGGTAEARFGHVLSLTGLQQFGGGRVSTLPISARRRLGLACALIGESRVLLLDDPGADLDPVSRREVLSLARRLAAGGAAVVWSTPDFAEAERCGRVLLLSAGQLIGGGRPAELGAGLAGRVLALPATGQERRRVAARLRRVAGIRAVEIESASVRIVTDRLPGEAWLRGLAEIGPPLPAAPRVEDVFTDPPAAPPAGVPPPRSRKCGDASGPAILARGLTKRFGNATVVDAVDLDVAKGEIFGILGPSGAGKTTILRLLCGLVPPTAGESRMAGVDLRRAPAAARAVAGLMSQAFSLCGELPVADNLRFLARAYGLGRRQATERIGQLIAEFGLEACGDLNAGALPVSLKQRLALAATLVHEPEILLLDEPTMGTDPPTCRALWRRIEAHAAAGAAVLVTTRRAAEGEQCDRLILLHHGRAVAAGRPDELLAQGSRAGAAEGTLDDTFAALIAAKERRDAA